MKSVKTSEFKKRHNFHLWVNPVCLVKSWSKWISWSDLFVLFKRHLSTNLSFFLFVSEQQNFVSLLFFRSFYTSPQKLGGEEISLTLDPGGFRLMRQYENLFVGPFPFCLKPSFFIKSIIINLCCHIWANIFLGGVPFVCSSNFFLEIFTFSWTLIIFVCFSFCLFVANTLSFWEIL